MKKLAFTALCIGSLGLFACGGGSSDDVDAGDCIPVCGDSVCDCGETEASCADDCTATCNNDGVCDSADGETTANCPADCPPPPACNAVAGTGCANGEKCTFIVESTDPLMGSTGCAPAGTVAAGGACTRSETTGVDDCAAGLYCSGGVCEVICGTLDNTNCGANETCVSFFGLFDDSENTGLCQPGCNPVGVTTGCPTGEGCYVSLTTGLASCAMDCGDDLRPYPDGCGEGATGSTVIGENTCNDTTNWGTQHCNCRFLNGCAPGYGCHLLNDPDNFTSFVCAYYCDTTASGGPSCPPGSSLGATSCRRISEFYSDSQNVPAAIGMCVDGADLGYNCFGCLNDTDDGCTVDLCPP